MQFFPSISSLGMIITAPCAPATILQALISMRFVGPLNAEMYARNLLSVGEVGLEPNHVHRAPDGIVRLTLQRDSVLLHCLPHVASATVTAHNIARSHLSSLAISRLDRSDHRVNLWILFIKSYINDRPWAEHRCTTCCRSCVGENLLDETLTNC